jgi:uncharacterized membrane protein YfhO
VLAELAIPLLAILALKQWFANNSTTEIKLNALKKTLYSVGGLALLFTLFGTSLFAFEGLRDESYSQLLPGLLDAIIADRKAVFFADSLRTLILVLITAGLLWLFLKQKLKINTTIIAFGILIMFDLVTVNKRYVNNDDFMNAREIDKPFIASEIDKEILKDTTYYRVANFAVDPMNDGSTSYFHNSIGGYHAAKLGRYQELFDYQIAKNNIEVLNMLNTKYFMFIDGNQKLQAQQNPDANGNAWFVNTLKVVKNADEEIVGLDSIKSKEIALIDERFITSNFITSYPKDSIATIALKNYKDNHLTYSSKSTQNQFAVFSEIYYKDGWNAYIDGELKPHYRVNYVLRGLEIPAGTHIIEFKFEPTIIQKGTSIALVSYALLLFIPIGWFFIEKKKKNVR